MFSVPVVVSTVPTAGVQVENPMRAKTFCWESVVVVKMSSGTSFQARVLPVLATNEARLEKSKA
jgi:hypothetical protein